MMAAPPRLALLLLDRLSPTDEALSGDLVEEYQCGRSRAWFWSQVVTAVAIGAARSVRANGRRAAGAILAGLLLAALGDAAFARTVESVGYVGPWMTPTLWLLMSSVVVGLEQFTIGAIVGRLARPAGPPVALAYAAMLMALATIPLASLVFGDVVRGERLWAVSQYTASVCVAVVTAVIGGAWASGSRGSESGSLGLEP